MGWPSNRQLAGLVVSILLAGACAIGPSAAAARGPGALDPSFGDGGHAFARSYRETLPSRFRAVAPEPNGDLVLEAIYRDPTRETRRVIEMRTPAGGLEPSFDEGGRLPLESGAGLTTLADGDILVGVHHCDGAASSVEMLDPTGAKAASFGADGCAPPIGFGVRLLTTDAQGRILVAGTRIYCPPCEKDTVRRTESDVARLLPDGSRDLGFGQEGLFGTHFSLGLESPGDFVGIQPKDLGATADGGAVLGVDGMAIRLEPNGVPDQAYGTSGAATLSGGVERFAVEPDGSTLVAASDSKDGVYLRKLSPTGAPDPGFGKEGTATLPLRYGTRLEVAAPVPGGGFLVGGEEAPAQNCDKPCQAELFLARVTSSGRLDPAFGKKGIADLGGPVPWRRGSAALLGLTMAPDGSAVVAGRDGGRDAWASAWTPSGHPQTSFGKGGTIVEHRAGTVQLESVGLAVGGDGRLTLSTRRSTTPGESTGQQSSFGADGGALQLPGGARTVDSVENGTLVSLGGRGVAIWAGNEPKPAEGLASAGPDGRPLPGWGTHGSAAFPEGFVAESVAPAPGGGVLAVGRVERGTEEEKEYEEGRQLIAVFRLGPNGRPARGFGRHGLVVVGFPHAESIAYAGLVQADGDVVVTGRADEHLVAARLLPDGRLDPRYGHGGRVRVALGGSTAGGLIAPAGAGVVVAALKVEQSRYVLGGLLRLDSRGRLVRGFGRHGIVHAVAEREPLALFAGGGRIVTVSDPLYENGHEGGGVELRSYKPDGAVDRAFGERGVRFFGAGTDEEHAFTPAAAVQQADGKVVVAGTARDGRRSRAELLRFLVR